MSKLTGDRVVIVAEMANAHEGELARALQIAEAAASAGADALKVQLFSADELVAPTHPNYSLFRRLQMSGADWRSLAAGARSRGLMLFADVFGLDSLELASVLEVDAVKVHAADVENLELLEAVGARRLPALVSAGGSTWLETREAVQRLEAAGCPEIVAVCGFQAYPTPVEDTNLRRIPVLRDRVGCPVGFAGHADGGSDDAVMQPLLAMAAGAQLLEVHLTLDRAERSLDFESSLEPARFAEMVRLIRDNEVSLGSPGLSLTPGELQYRSSHRKVAVAARDLEEGARLGAADLRLLRSPGGETPSVREVSGRQMRRSKRALEPIERGDVVHKPAAVIACRAESSRLYAKPLQTVGGIAILDHLIGQLRRTEAGQHVVLAIADTPSRGVFEAYAGDRGLAFVVGSERDVLARLIAGAELAEADVVIRVTSENPFIYWENLDELVRTHIEEGCDLTVTSGLPVGTAVEVVSAEALRRSHTHGDDRHRSELCTLFISEHPDAFKIRRVAAPERLRRPELRLTVDYPEDLVLARHLWDALSPDGDVTVERIVTFLDDHPEVARINDEMETLNLWK